MLDEFGVSSDHEYPKVYIEDTDTPLSSLLHNPGIRYTHHKVIARGGKCVIKSCRDNHLNRVVAYKTLHEHLRDDRNEQRRFLREARVTAALQHPNTIPVYEIGRDNHARYYFTMKLVHGFTIGGIIQKLKEGDGTFVPRYTLDTLLGIVVQVCNCLNFAHAHGVVHRDIKPENIITGTFGEVFILDWGLAKIWNMPQEQYKPSTQPITDVNLTAGGKLQATPLYMSPEQLESREDIDHRTDIYSLGAVLYEMLTWQSYLEADNIHMIIRQIESGEVVSPRDRAPDRFIPEELERICLKCLRKDPAKRYQGVDELISDIRRFRLGSMGS